MHEQWDQRLAALQARHPEADTAVIADVVRALHEIPISGAVVGAILAVTLYGALATCEAIIAGVVAGPVSPRRAALGGFLASSIGHVLGLGAVSGGAIRYRLYSAVGMRPLEIGKASCRERV